MTDRRIIATTPAVVSSRPNGPVPLFSFGLVLTVGAATAPYKFRGTKVVTGFLATLSVEDSIDIVIAVYYNKNLAIPLTTITIAGTTDEKEVDGPFRFVSGDYLQMAIFSCGSTASGLLVQALD